MSKQDPAARLSMLESEVTRLQKELAVLQRQWDQKYRLGAFGLLALPAAYWGLAYSLIIVLCTPALIATQAYLIGVRRNECRELIGEAKREIAMLRKKLAAKAPEGSDKASEGSNKAAEGSDKAAEGSDKAVEGSDKAAEGSDKAGTVVSRSAGDAVVLGLDGRDQRRAIDHALHGGVTNLAGVERDVSARDARDLRQRLAHCHHAVTTAHALDRQLLRHGSVLRTEGPGRKHPSRDQRPEPTAQPTESEPYCTIGFHGPWPARGCQLCQTSSPLPQ